MSIVLLWFGFSIVAVTFASGKGSNGIGYFLLSLLVSPLIGLLIVVCLPSRLYVDPDGVLRRVKLSSPEDQLLPEGPVAKVARWFSAAVILLLVVGIGIYIVGNLIH